MVAVSNLLTDASDICVCKVEVNIDLIPDYLMVKPLKSFLSGAVPQLFFTSNGEVKSVYGIAG